MENEEENQQEEDFDYDFTQYEDDEDEDQQVQAIESLKKLKRPVITGLRSRFSMGEREFDRVAEVKKQVGELSIQVSARTQDLNILWTFYGTLQEYWESIRNIYGEVINQEMTELFRKAEDKLDSSAKQGNIPSEVHKALIRIRSKLYRISQLSNLGFETERITSTTYNKAKKSIVQ